MIVPAVTSLVYGALVFAGGWMGFRKAQSRPSLLAGAASGVLLLVAALLSFGGNAVGERLGMVVAFVLLAFFGYRFARGRKFMPAGLMVLASLGALALYYFSGSPRP